MIDDLDPLRHIEGFPLGKDEALIALSNPPCYTAYPNPHIADFIKQYGKPYDEASDFYHREPFTQDISSPKNDSFYTVHSYHTKVPDEIIQKYIAHYTEPDDIVIDFFSGSGMTGVASQALKRNAILIDLCPMATHISNNYLKLANAIPLMAPEYFNRIIGEIEREWEWMYQTERGQLLNWCVWSEILECPYCSNPNVFNDTSTSNNSIKCSKCGAELPKKGLVRVIDGNNGGFKPVLVNFGSGSYRKQRGLSGYDSKLIQKISELEIPYWYPDQKLDFKEKKWGNLAKGNHRGFTHYYQFYPRRTLIILAAFRDKISKIDDASTKSFLLFVMTAAAYGLTVFNRFLPERNSNVGMLANTLFIPPLYSETNAIQKLKDKFKAMVGVQRGLHPSEILISTQSATDLSQIPSNSLDYAFIDPPFGENILYVSSNSVSECWLKVSSNGLSEAIISEWRNKSPIVYRNLLADAFRELFRVLKPSRWITVEFHNSKALIWNYLQEAIIKSGFVIAQVTVMDKQGTTIFMDTRSGAVDKDLVISAYKPRDEFSQKMLSDAGYLMEKRFVEQHLRMLPVETNVERTANMIYSKYLAFYVQHSFRINYNSEQFYRALSQWGLEERDGYWFADEAQAHEYEGRKVQTFGKKGAQPQAVLFVSDERSARQWIWSFLDQPKTYNEIYTKFVPALQTSEDEIPELRTMLEESFVRTDGHWKRPDQLTQAELEKKRLERLLRQFNEYMEAARAGQKVKEVRREAVLAGFTECYREGRFQDIVTLGRKLDKRLLEESPDLFDFVDIAEAKVES